MAAAIKPYSMAVAPLVSWKKRLARYFAFFMGQSCKKQQLLVSQTLFRTCFQNVNRLSSFVLIYVMNDRSGDFR
jgi:hypothetical protein